ncbi:MAG: tRNA (adenosine(37)-N6)-threonylcarbamoyltransferase complex dimerization subunit type 1 TsaB [Candidatus Dormibacter sp.]
MSVIAIDTAARLAAWVLRTDPAGHILDQREVPGGQLDARLAGAVAELLDDTVEAIVVLTGPGSYSGVRAGMAAALGLASARGVPLHGAGNLLAVAALAARAGDGEAIVAVADAGRGGVYLARFVARLGRPEQVSEVERHDAATVESSQPLVATTGIGGLDVRRVDPRSALAAAVPWALARPPLMASGLAATHARPARDDGRADAFN